jgi:hypothetical protein
MDPLTALAFAANVIQFAGFSANLLKTAHHAYRETKDLLHETRALQQVLKKLELEVEKSAEQDHKERKKRLEFLFELLRFLQGIACFLQGVLWGLICSSVFSVFGKRKRPRCTTMPWDIWPSLVVLWGVCWMFYAPISLSESQHGFEDDQFPDFIPG